MSPQNKEFLPILSAGQPDEPVSRRLQGRLPTCVRASSYDQHGHINEGLGERESRIKESRPKLKLLERLQLAQESRSLQLVVTVLNLDLNFTALCSSNGRS
jgi:hypothetical protein